MIRSFVLMIALALLWLGLSGHYSPLLLAFGAISVIVTLLVASQMRIVDRESTPYLLLLQAIDYWMWLFGEIVKANWTVFKACLKVELDIEPGLVSVKTMCKSDLARTTFANSITLTPGTVTLSVEGENLLVHALYASQTDPDDFSEMDERVAQVFDDNGAGR